MISLDWVQIGYDWIRFDKFRLDQIRLYRFDQIRLLWIRLKGSIPWDYIRLGYGDQILDGLDRIGYDKVEGQIDRQIDRQTDRQIDRLDRQID